MEKLKHVGMVWLGYIGKAESFVILVIVYYLFLLPFAVIWHVIGSPKRAVGWRRWGHRSNTLSDARRQG